MRAPTPLDQPRAIGAAYVRAKKTAAGSAIDGLRQSGAYKVLFPRQTRVLEGIVINTAGGVTGGDSFELQAIAGSGSRLTITTQAAERGYAAQAGQKGRISTTLKAESQSALCWLPQETILYNGAAIDRKLVVEIDRDARFLMVEPILFGRHAMGEDVTKLAFRDRVIIRRAGRPLYRDGLNLTGNQAEQMDRPAIGQGARAMASLVYVAPDAAGRLDTLRDHLGAKGGASMLGEDVLVARVLAEDGFDLRRSLIPVLENLTENTLPQSWRL
jgi:urease accessory protein